MLAAPIYKIQPFFNLKLYNVIISEPIMLFQNNFGFRLFYGWEYLVKISFSYLYSFRYDWMSIEFWEGIDLVDKSFPTLFVEKPKV